MFARQSQADSLLSLQQLCSDQEGGTPLDTQLEADDEAGEDEWFQANHRQANESPLPENTQYFIRIVSYLGNYKSYRNQQVIVIIEISL